MRRARTRADVGLRLARDTVLAALLLALGMAAVLAVRDAQGQSPVPPAPAPLDAVPPAAPSLAPPPPASPPGGPGLAVGITEPNPNFVWPAPQSVPEPFGRWRDALAEVRPDTYRLVVEWRIVQPDAGRPPNLEVPSGGCLRDRLPCAGWLGVRDQLRALAARQRDGGWDGMVVITGTPEWAAEPAGGCERPGTQTRSRAPRADALPAYRRLVADVLAAAAQEGAQLSAWSPWNEPNHPYFLSPQRAACDLASPSQAPVRYAELARAMLAELDAAPGDQRLVLGELSGARRPTRHVTGVQEFMAGLPADVACRASVVGQHAYVGGPDPVDEVLAGLAVHACPSVAPVWITETGAGAPPEDLAPAAAFADTRAACRALDTSLRRWHTDPRVTAAFQYTLREDDRFPTGLVTTSLDGSRPVLDLWRAWAQASRTTGAPPAPGACDG